MFISTLAHKKLLVRLALVLICLTISVLSLILLPPQSGAQLTAPQGGRSKKAQRPRFVPGDVLVRYRSESLARSKSGKSSMLATSEGRLVSARIEHFGGSELVSGLRIARVAPEATLDAVAAFRKQPDVLYAEPNYILRIARVPNDTHWIQGRQPSFSKVGLPNVWDFTIGDENRNIVVAVLDQGFKPTHEDLVANVWNNPSPGAAGLPGDLHGFNFINHTGTFFVQNDAEFHATHVAGIIGAVGDNSIGVAGVNWKASLMSLKFLDEEGFGSTSDAIQACNYANQMRNLWETSVPTHSKGANIRVINASFGEKSFNQSFRDAIHSLSVATHPILFVAAAGNVADGTREPNNDLIPEYPANYNESNIISVGASKSTDDLAAFSHFGASSVDLAAPGVDILSTTPPCANPGPAPKLCLPDFPVGAGPTTDTYTRVSGTSMAAPHVTGAAALLWSQDPTLTVTQVKSLLLLNGDIIPALIGKTLTGRRLNVENSFLAMLTADTTNPGGASNFRIASQSGRSFNLGWTASGDDGATGRAALYQLSYTDSTPGAVEIPLKGVIPGKSGAAQLGDVKVPFRHTAGTLKLREFDEKGNEGPVQSLDVGIPLSAADPYTTSTGGVVGLTTGGHRINLGTPELNDDGYSELVFPGTFVFPFFGTNQTSVTISTNGALYFSTPYERPDGTADDVPSSPGAIGGQQMIAGLWDDLTIQTTAPLRADAGVYWTAFPNETNPNRIVFRWQAQPCNFDGLDCSGGSPINFEIELNSNGVIKTRYGTGNANVFPAVGIGGGEQEGYAIASHSSEEAPISLNNANEVTFTPRAQTVSTIQLSQSAISVNENATSLTVTVNRTGDTTSVATVNYNTADTDNFTIGCSQNSGGNAFGRCDYASAVDTLTFAAGETSKTFTISIIDDVIVEGNESFTISLSSPTGATLGATTSATVTITDNDVAGGANPIFTTAFFVRQHYLDFLSREPEQGEPWSGVLNNCSDVNNNPACDRLTVSGAFFGSPEFQLKGYFVYRFYKLAFNRLPTYTEMVTDMRAVTGQTANEVFQKKAAYVLAFMQRPEFASLNAMTNNQFVMTLMGRYTLTNINTPDPELPDGSTKIGMNSTDMVAQLNIQTLTRAQVLRAIVDSDQVFSAEFNQAFVAMQYYGYLRRAPDQAGYTAWLNYLNANPNDSRTMVSGFMNSAEYRLRFGPPN